MTKSKPDIGRASEADLDGIVGLQAENQPERGGALSASLPRSRIAEMMREMPLIVARRGEHISGFLMTSTRAMLAADPGTLDAYVYGPVCVEAEERGKGLAQTMFSELRRFAPVREGFFSSDATTRPHCAPTQRWACVKSPVLCSAETSLPFSPISGETERPVNDPTRRSRETRQKEVRPFNSSLGLNAIVGGPSNETNQRNQLS